MSALVLPFWFKQRQAKAEPAGENIFKLTAPNLGEAFIAIRKDETGRWLGAFKQAADGPHVEATDAIYETPADAWGAAFEIYRRRVVT